MRRTVRRHGFTLVEIIAVVVILGVLCGLLVLGTRGASVRGEEAVAQNLLRQVANSVTTTLASTTGGGVDRGMVEDAIAKATRKDVSASVSDGAHVFVGGADVVPSVGGFAVGFDGPEPDSAGSTVAIILGARDRSLVQVVSRTGRSTSGWVSLTTTPKQVLAGTAVVIPFKE